MARQARPRRPHRAAWFWWLAAVCLLKVAAPLLAALAAQHRGVDLVEVCSVYGVRTVALTNAADDPGPAAPQPEADGMGHSPCALSGLLSQALVVLAVLGWLLPAAARHLPTQHPPRTVPPPDAQLRWLGARLHAPPALS